MYKPILFNTEMVKAILDGRKTVTRRIISEKVKENWESRFWDCERSNKFCKYKVGDILWVRETWQEVFETEYMDFDDGREIKNIRECILNFDSICKKELGKSTNWSWGKIEPRMEYVVYKADDLKYADEKYSLRWKPSIHMPKSAARIFIKVTDVRVEKLQDITDGQCMKEGISEEKVTLVEDMFPNLQGCNAEIQNGSAEKSVFGDLWDSTVKDGNYFYSANPYVWVIEFELCEKPKDFE